MTTSQVKAAVGTALAIVGAVGTALLPFADILPPAWAKGVPMVIAVAGAILAAMNQSLAPGHVSIPVEEAKAVGVAPEQTEGK